MAKSRTKTRRPQPQQPIKPDLWSNLKSWQQHVIILAVLLLLPLFLHSPVFLGGQTLATHDIIQWRAGAESLMEHRDTYGEQAQWSTNMFSGMPAYVISNVERFPHFDTVIQPLFRSLFPLLEYWILISGAYVFLLLLGFRPLISATGAILIAFTTYIPIIVGAGHNTKFIAYAWIPWIFAGFRLIMSRRDLLWAGLALFIFAFMMHVRAGHPQVTYYFLFLMAIWWLHEGHEARLSGNLRTWFQQTALLVSAGLLTLLSVSEQYWAIYDYSQFSIRGGSEVDGTSGLPLDYAFVWSQGRAELLTLAIPNLFGGGELYWGPKPVTSGPHYFGALAVLLFAFGLIKANRFHIRVFLLTGVIGILFSLGKHFSLLNETMFSYFPLFDKFRTPEMWLILTVFCFTIIAMDGLTWIADRAGKLADAGKSWWIASGSVAGLGLVLLILSGSSFSYERPDERNMIAQQIASQNQVAVTDPRVRQATDRIINEQIVPERKDAARADIIRYLILVGIGTGVIWLLLSGKLMLSIGLGILFLVSAYDLTSAGKRYIPESAYSPGGLPVEQVIQRQKREVDRWVQEAIRTEEPWTYRVFPLADNPFNNAIPSAFYPTIGGYSGARLSSYDDLQGLINESLSGGDLDKLNRILSMLNVRYIIHTSRIPGYNQVFRDDQRVVLENPNVLPKAWFVSEIIPSDSANETLDAIRTTRDLRNTAIVRSGSDIRVQSDSLASVTISRYNAHQIDLQVTHRGDGFLVLGEIYYPGGWIARLNGEPVDIRRVNHVLRGVQIPDGTHELTFRFEPEWYPKARLLSNSANILALLALLMLVVVQVRERRSGQPDSNQLSEEKPDKD